MASTDFYIELDNPARSFFSGQLITGRVVSILNEEKRTEGIKIAFVGKATVRWTESETVNVPGPGNHHHHNSHHISNPHHHSNPHHNHHHHNESHMETRTVTYSADEEYFNININLLGNGGAKILIPAGRQAYPFQFTLPQNLPSSFKGQYGSVEYTATATMQRSWNFDKKTILPFTVNGILDLNHEPSASMPLNEKSHKNVGFCCCESGPVGYVLQIPKRGYVPGESIKITAEMDNKSNKRVNKITLFLIKDIHYHARGKSKMDSRLVSECVGPSVDPGESEIWRGNVLRIPAIPPTSSIGSCRLIEIRYKLQIEMDLSGFTRNLKSMIPIYIGTIPLRNMFEELTSNPTTNRPDINFISSSLAGPSLNNFQPHLSNAIGFEAYPDLPPPTYAEAFSSTKITFQSERNKSKGQKTIQEGHINEIRTEEYASAPPAENIDFVPNYITYGR